MRPAPQRRNRSGGARPRPARALAAALLCGLAVPPATGAERVEFANAEGTVLTAHWLPAPADGARPAIVALHGCGGLYRRDGRTLESRYTDYAARFAAAGYHLLLPDSFGSRGSGPICATRDDERRITVETRRADAVAAVRWREDFALDTPLLMLLGERDDWTPPQRCLQLAERTRARRPSADFTVRVYPDSYHGFDGRAPLRFRRDVPNGVSPEGVHAGGNPVAREQALAELDRFLQRILN